ncbi:MAG: hypothetical protein IPK83_03310 [Planctomycetes bacterium]|nr:hypothetical protein [Planctomycetota bacterium]
MLPIPILLLAASLPAANPVNVKFSVSVPKDTPPNAKVYIAGNIPALGSWRADGLQLVRNKSASPVWDLYEVEFEAHSRENVEFKFTLGTWDSVEKDENGNDIPNRVHTIATHEAADGSWVIEYPTFQVARWASTDAKSTTPAKPPERKSTRTGDIRLHENFESRELANKRSLIVYLPPGYEDPANKDERYPVLYMHDGQNLFDAATSFIGVEWNADETAERLIKAKKIPPIIIVGIYNTPDRMNEYTPTRDEKRGTGGKGDMYLSFVVNKVKPFIDSTYRTSTKRRDTAIAGSSLGGLISLHMAVRYPNTFARAGVISPALFWDDHEIVRRIEETPVIVAKFKSLVTRRASRGHCLPVGDPVETKTEQDSPRIWLDMGTKEGDTLATFNTALEDTRRLAAALKKAGLRENEDYKYVEVQDALHNEAAWAARFEDVLLFFWGDMNRRTEPEKKSTQWYKRVMPLTAEERELEAGRFYTPQDRKDREALYALLLSADTFDGMEARRPSCDSVAFKLLFEDPDAPGLFRDLINRANKTGQLYALCGLWQHDRPAFDRAIERYKIDQEPVHFSYGCTGGNSPAHMIVEHQGPCVYRLKPNQTPIEWDAENPCGQTRWDILGGGYTWRLSHPMWLQMATTHPSSD